MSTDKGFQDDLCEACGKRVANHETDSGILCDRCFKQVYPKGETKMANDKVGIWVEHGTITLWKRGTDSPLGQTLRKRKTVNVPLAKLSNKQAKELGLLLIRNTLMVLVVAVSVLPSNVRAQSINSASDVYDATKGVTNVSSHQSINHDQTSSGGSLGINPLLQPEVHKVETGSKNDSNWTGPNFFVTLEEAKQLAEQQRLATANNTLSIAEAAKKAKEEADKAKAASTAKTVTVAVQDADGNVVYVKKARKP